MKLLIDANLSAKVATLLREAGVEAVHVEDLGLRHATDEVILDRVVLEGAVVVTLDDDFPEMLALTRAQSPSAIHLRGVAHLHPADHAALLIEAAADLERELSDGACIVSLTRGRMRVRRLPIT